MFFINQQLFTQYDKVILVQFYQKSGLILLNNYTSEKTAKDQKDKYSIGIWKIKSLKTT